MISRSEFKGNYTQIHNEIFNNPDMSAKAKGILAQLLSKPDTWRLNVQYLVNTNKEGHHAIRSTIKELEEHNYIHRFVTRENGKIAGTEYLICDRVTSRVDAEAVFNAGGGLVSDAENNTCMQDSRIQVSSMQKTAPIINTDVSNTLNKKTLKETTTTPAPVAPVLPDQSGPVPSSSFSHEILNLIPEKHQSPVVLTFVNKALNENGYKENEVKHAVAYSALNVTGGSLQFKVYLEKTLRGRRADGWSPEHETQAEKKPVWEQFEGFCDNDLKMLADVGNIAAREELERREGQRTPNFLSNQKTKRMATENGRA